MSEFIITCDEETASWIGNDVDSMRPIVRCGDCKYADPEPPSDRRSRKKYQGGYWCDYWSEGIGAWCEPDGFCAWGVKRKEGE